MACHFDVVNCKLQSCLIYTSLVQVLFHTGREDDPGPGSIGIAVLNRYAQGSAKPSPASSFRESGPCVLFGIKDAGVLMQASLTV